MMSYIKYTIIFHILNDIKIVETYNGNEYYVDIDVRKGKSVYYLAIASSKGFSLHAWVQ